MKQISANDPRLHEGRTVRITRAHFDMPDDVDYIDSQACAPLAVPLLHALYDAFDGAEEPHLTHVYVDDAYADEAKLTQGAMLTYSDGLVLLFKVPSTIVDFAVDGPGAENDSGERAFIPVDMGWQVRDIPPPNASPAKPQTAGERCPHCGLLSPDAIRRNIDATVALNLAEIHESAETYQDGTPVFVGRARVTYPEPRVVTARGCTFRRVFERLREQIQP